MTTAPRELDVVVIGGGQSALAVGFYLRRTGLSHVLLDCESGPGGAWRAVWPSLVLFSPPQWSSLPGWFMPPGANEYPTRAELLDYLASYERRYALPIERSVQVLGVHRDGDRLRVETDAGDISARAVVSATGTAHNPVRPVIPGRERFRGRVLHSSEYAGPTSFVDHRVVVVGGGNSGAQIVAELSRVADVRWATQTPPRFLPDGIDGRALFEQASARFRAMQEGRETLPPRSLGDVVMVQSLREARARGALRSVPMFVRFTKTGVVWPDDREERVDAVLFATGFLPSLGHLAPLDLPAADGRIPVEGTRAVGEPRLWLVGYGDWTGYASATLIGVGRSARATVAEIVAAIPVASAPYERD